MLLALGAKDGSGERAIHAVITAAQPACQQHQFALDIIHFTDKERPAWIDAFQLAPIYERGWGARLMGPPSKISQ